MAGSNDDDEEKVARLDLTVESQEAMGAIVHSHKVLIAGGKLVLFAFGTIAEADLGLTDINDFLNKAHRFPFLAESTSCSFCSSRILRPQRSTLTLNPERRIKIRTFSSNGCYYRLEPFRDC
jgi:hypothetical protein